MDKYKALNVLNEAGIILEKRNRVKQDPLTLEMEWAWDLGSMSEKFQVRSFESSVIDTYRKGATYIYNYKTDPGHPEHGWWWLALKARVRIQNLSCHGGTFMRLDFKKVDEFKAKIVEKNGGDKTKIPTLEEILEFGCNISNWIFTSSMHDAYEVSDGRRYNLCSKVVELAGGNYKDLKPTRKVIRALNALIKNPKVEPITQEDVDSAIAAAKTKFKPDTNHNYRAMMKALQAVGFTDLKTVDTGDVNDYGEKYIGFTIGKLKGNPVKLYTTQAAFENCNIFDGKDWSFPITQEQYEKYLKMKTFQR